jgi:hypothetical protein
MAPAGRLATRSTLAHSQISKFIGDIGAEFPLSLDGGNRHALPRLNIEALDVGDLFIRDSVPRCVEGSIHRRM